jgi:hypothetical protein
MTLFFFCRYAHMSVCAVLWLCILPSQLVSLIGMGIGDYFYLKDLWYYNAFWNRVCFMALHTITTLFMTFSTRFPDAWVGMWSVMMVTLMYIWRLNDEYFFGVSAMVLICTFIFAAIVFMMRIQILLQSKLEIRKRKDEFAHAFESTLSASVDAPEQLARLERCVGSIEQSIPTGTVARQYNLKAGQLPRLADPQVQASMTSFSRLESRPSNRTSSLFSDVGLRRAGQFRSGGRVNPELPFVSSLVEADREIVHPCDMVSSWAQKKLVDRSFETVLAATSMPIDYVHDSMHPIESTDQLWTQAMLLKGPLLAKVLALSRRCNGMFQRRDFPGNFERPGEEPIAMSSPSNGNLRMGNVKGVERGIAKVDSTYGGDVSRLLDVCRERIVFGSIKDLTDCIEELSNDPEVSVVRIKSSMTKAGLNPTVPSGLRFISVNMRIQNVQTRKLAISAHVCEVLLMLKSCAELITPEVHQKYIRYRNSHSAFNFTVIPGSNLLYEGRRFATGVKDRSTIASLRSRKINSVVQPIPEHALGSQTEDEAVQPGVSIVIQRNGSDDVLPGGGDVPVPASSPPGLTWPGSVQHQRSGLEAMPKTSLGEVCHPPCPPPRASSPPRARAK